MKATLFTLRDLLATGEVLLKVNNSKFGKYNIKESFYKVFNCGFSKGSVSMYYSILADGYVDIGETDLFESNKHKCRSFITRHLLKDGVFMDDIVLLMANSTATDMSVLGDAIIHIDIPNSPEQTVYAVDLTMLDIVDPYEQVCSHELIQLGIRLNDLKIQEKVLKYFLPDDDKGGFTMNYTQAQAQYLAEHNIYENLYKPDPYKSKPTPDTINFKIKSYSSIPSMNELMKNMEKDNLKPVLSRMKKYHDRYEDIGEEEAKEEYEHVMETKAELEDTLVAYSYGLISGETKILDWEGLDRKVIRDRNTLFLINEEFDGEPFTVTVEINT